MKKNQKKRAALDYLHDVVLPYRGSECLIWPFACNEFGYGQVMIKGRCWRVGRFVCTERYGADPSKHTRHLCGNGAQGCVNPQHMIWGTKAENEADKLVHGTHNRGSQNPQAKLTERQVIEIREAVCSLSTLSKRYGVSASLVGLIRQGKRWGWLCL